MPVGSGTDAPVDPGTDVVKLPSSRHSATVGVSPNNCRGGNGTRPIKIGEQKKHKQKPYALGIEVKKKYKKPVNSDADTGDLPASKYSVAVGVPPDKHTPIMIIIITNE